MVEDQKAREVSSIQAKISKFDKDMVDLRLALEDAARTIKIAIQRWTEKSTLITDLLSEREVLEKRGEEELSSKWKALESARNELRTCEEALAEWDRKRAVLEDPSSRP